MQFIKGGTLVCKVMLYYIRNRILEITLMINRVMMLLLINLWNVKFCIKSQKYNISVTWKNKTVQIFILENISILFIFFFIITCHKK